MSQLAYRRVLLKLSGEALMGNEDYGIDPAVLNRLAHEVIEAQEPSPLSPYSTAERRDDAFGLLEDTIGEVFPDAVPAPYVMMAATDSRHFTAITDRVYRFAPFRMTKAQREAIHSYDEHLGVDAFLDGVRWYQRLLEGLPA